jgi:hypothetical protein
METTMARFDNEKLNYFEKAEEIREGLHTIPQQYGRDKYVAQHDRLIAHSIPLSDLREQITDLNPEGASGVDFAVPRFLDTLYEVALEGEDFALRFDHLGDDVTPSGLWDRAMENGILDQQRHAHMQELEARAQQRIQGPGVVSLMPEYSETLERFAVSSGHSLDGATIAAEPVPSGGSSLPERPLAAQAAVAPVGVER